MIALLTPWSVCNKCLRRAVTRGPHPPPPTGEGYDRYSGNIRPIALFPCRCGCGRIGGGLWTRWCGAVQAREPVF